MLKQVHVIEGAIKRRAQVALTLNGMGIANEIYEDLDELLQRVPQFGVIMANDGALTSACECILSSLQSRDSYLPVIMYSEEPSPEQIVEAMLSGALDYLTWPILPKAVSGAFMKLDRVAAGRVARERKSAEARKRVKALSSREIEVLRNVTKGLSSRAIADTLGISSRTVDVHRARMITKLNARSTAEAVRIAIYAGLDR